MKKLLKNTRGITLVALVITIIILLILAGITIAQLTGNGLFDKAKRAKEESEKQAATEKMNLKITQAEMSSWAKEQRMPTLQELANEFCENEDDEFEYVLTASKKTGSKLENIVVADSIFTKFKEYPYEFEIDSELKLASINGVKVGNTSNSEIENTIFIKLKEIDRKTIGNNVILTLGVGNEYETNLQNIEVYKIDNNKTEQVYKGNQFKFDVTVENGREYQFYAKGTYLNSPILLGVDTTLEKWQLFLQLANVNFKNYSTLDQALNNSEVLTAIKGSENALKYLALNKELFDKVSAKDTAVDNEMIKVGVIPVLTGNKSITPYVIETNAVLGDWEGWHAFNQNLTYPNLWHCNSSKPCYIQIDLGSKTNVKTFSLTTTDIISSMPKDFIFQGSNDGKNWTDIKTYTNFADYKPYETTLFDLEQTAIYRYYRLWITTDNGYGFIAITEVQFYN